MPGAYDIYRVIICHPASGTKTPENGVILEKQEAGHTLAI